MQEITSELTATTNELLNTIDSFSEAQFNTVPFEGSWTAGQVSEHLLKSESGLPAVWQGKTQITPGAADERVPTIEGIFLDFTTKLKSPEFILPSDEPKNKEALYQSLKLNRARITQLAKTINLSLTYTDLALPGLGNLTGIEWASFIISHSKRHIHQLKNIHEKITVVLN